jgi:hypothetical protein
MEVGDGAAAAEAAAAAPAPGAAAAAAAPIDVVAELGVVHGLLQAQQNQLAAILSAPNVLRSKQPETFSGDTQLDVETWLFQVLQ